MKESIFLTSFFSNQQRGSKFLTSPAILVGNWVVSNLEIFEIPLRPSQRPFQVSSVPVPSAVTKPTPVTTTLLFCKIRTSFSQTSRGLQTCDSRRGNENSYDLGRWSSMYLIASF